MLVIGLNGALVGGFSDVIRYLIPSIRLGMGCVCHVNVLHQLSRRNLVHVCGHRSPILKDCLNLRNFDEASNPM